MDYVADVNVVFGIRVPESEIKTIARIFFPEIPEADLIYRHSSYDEWLSDTLPDGIRIVPGYPYYLRTFDNSKGRETYLILDTVEIGVVDSGGSEDPTVEFQIPSDEEVKLFLSVLGRYNLFPFPYRNYLVINSFRW